MPPTTAARRKSSKGKGKARKSRKPQPEVEDEDEVMDDLEDELDAALEDEDEDDLDEEIDDDEGQEAPKAEKPKKEKKDKGFICKSVAKKHGDEAKPCHSPTAPFRQSPARNAAFKSIQDAGVKGMSTENWIGDVATTFEDEGINGSPKGAVSFVQKATRRVALRKLPNGNHVVEEPLKDGSRRLFNKNGTVRKSKK